MKQADEIQALREEVAELRKQIGALIDLNIELARQAPYVAPVVVPYAPQPLPVRWQPPITPWTTSSNICSGRID